MNPSKLSLTALAIAKTQLGTVEEKGNKGPAVKMYLGSVGLGEGYSWCAGFVYWSFNEAAKKLGLINPLYKTGGVLKHYQQRKPYAVKEPQPGDIFIQDHGKGLGHTGIVDTVDTANKTFTTCEGNSNSKGSRTGGMVCSNTRPWSSCLAYLRY